AADASTAAANSGTDTGRHRPTHAVSSVLHTLSVFSRVPLFRFDSVDVETPLVTGAMPLLSRSRALILPPSFRFVWHAVSLAVCRGFATLFLFLFPGSVSIPLSLFTGRQYALMRCAASFPSCVYPPPLSSAVSKPENP
ncbi:unnamed protein product, partial [Phaeothamnion confervicola]